jgi:hypothetical protein
MALVQVAEIALPTHTKAGGFDHAAVHAARDRVYVAHTANDAVDVIDGATARCVGSIPSLTGVAGVLVSEEQDLVFTSNRGEDSVAWFSPAREEQLVRVRVGPRPNGLAYDPRRNRLLCANVGDPARPGSWSVSIVDVAQHAVMAELPAPGRTRWALFDVATEAFYVNIVEPPQIVVIEAPDPQRVARVVPIPVAGPHGLDLDPGHGRLFCGDFVLIASEVNPVAGALRANGIEVTALHNHALGDQPRLFYMHFWAHDDALKLARGLRAALDLTNSRR